MALNVFSLLTTVMLSRALFVACELNIAEYLEKNPLTINELSTKTFTHEKSLHRLLNFLVLHEVFTKDVQEKYHTTEFSKKMCLNHSYSIKPFLLHDDETRWNSFGHLGYSISTGKAAFQKLYDQNYFDYLKDHPSLSARFDEAMTIISTQEEDLIVKAISFQGTVADIGGGKGQLLNKIIQTNPDVKGILFDLPQVVDHLKETNLTSEKIPGSFFNPLSFKADVFILKRILHDWNDEKALQILTNISAAMENNSKLYIVDGIIDYAKNKELLAAIDLALLTVFQGQERTMSEIATIIAKAELEIIQIIEIDDILSALECRKKLS